jgi:hypothetical protein
LYAKEYHRLKDLEQIEAEDQRLAELMEQRKNPDLIKGMDRAKNAKKAKKAQKRARRKSMRKSSKDRTSRKRLGIIGDDMTARHDLAGGTDTPASPTHARGYQALNRSMKKLHSPRGSNPHEHLSDHEDEIIEAIGYADDVDSSLVHDAEIVAAHDFGSEHNELLHQINVIQCTILVGLDSVTQHASLHEYAGAIESLAMACTNIQAFTSMRLVDYVNTFIYLVRSADPDGTAELDSRKAARSNNKKKGKRKQKEHEASKKDDGEDDEDEPESKGDDDKEANDNEEEAEDTKGRGASSSSAFNTRRKKKIHENQVILSWQLSQIVRTIHIMVMGSHLLKRKLEVHASEEIRFYLCQSKFINNIDPDVLYNAETLRLLWEILWECLEANKTGDMTVLERINYRSSVLMWSWKEVTGKMGHPGEPEVTGDRHPESGALLNPRKKKGAIDHRAHEQINQVPPEIEYIVKLWRSKKHRKMFPTFYRGDLVAPSAESIASHNRLILNLLGDMSAAERVMQTVDHDGTVIRKAGDGYSSSSSSSSSSSLNTSEESYSSYSSDSGDSLSEGNHTSDDEVTSKRRRRKRQSRLRREKRKTRKITQLQLSGSDGSDGSDASHSSGSDEYGDLEKTTENISRAISMTGLSSVPLSARGRKRASGRRRSVVARGLVGFGKALLH